MEEVPFWRIIKNDYLALLLLILSPALLVGVALEGRDFSPLELNWALSIAGVLVLPCAVFLWKRVSGIRETLQSGQRLAGRIVSVWFHRDRGRLEFEYSYAGARRAGVAINKNSSTEALCPGQEIDLAVNPERPERPLVLGLYLRDGFRVTEAANRVFTGVRQR